MSIYEKPIDAMSETDLTELIDHQIAEGLTIEYKQSSYGTSDDDKKEALKDASSFANAQGGTIILGMTESEGLPISLVGIECDPDAECQRLNSLFRDCIEPRIVGLHPKAIRLANGNSAIVIRVPRSWQAPHRYSYKGTKRFFVRNSSGAHEANVEELRSMFMSSEEQVETARTFRRRRIEIIVANETPIPLHTNGRLVVHLLPVDRPDTSFQVDFELAQREMFLIPMGGPGSLDWGFNVDGLIVFRPAQESGYVQLFRNGAIESTNAGIMRKGQDGSVTSHAPTLEREILFKSWQYSQGMQKLGVPPPIICMFTFQGVKGGSIVWDKTFSSSMKPLHLDEIYLGDVVLEEYPTQQALFKALKRICDAIWNAAGQSKSPNFDAEGRWNESR